MSPVLGPGWAERLSQGERPDWGGGGGGWRTSGPHPPCVSRLSDTSVGSASPAPQPPTSALCTWGPVCPHPFLSPPCASALSPAIPSLSLSLSLSWGGITRPAPAPSPPFFPIHLPGASQPPPPGSLSLRLGSLAEESRIGSLWPLGAQNEGPLPRPRLSGQSKCLSCGLIAPATGPCLAVAAPGPGPSKQPPAAGIFIPRPGVGPVPTTALALPCPPTPAEPAWHQPAKGTHQRRSLHSAQRPLGATLRMPVASAAGIHGGPPPHPTPGKPQDAGGQRCRHTKDVLAPHSHSGPARCRHPQCQGS